MADLGDENLFWGAREPRSTDMIFPLQQEITDNTLDGVHDALMQLQQQAQSDQRIQQTIVPTGSDTLFRPHKTRVEMDLDADDDELKQNIDYIKKNPFITDVVIAAKDDVMNRFHPFKSLFNILKKIEHVTAVRCRSLMFNYRPHVFTRAAVHELGKLNDVSVAGPTRLEIETQFLHSNEFSPQHKMLSGILRNKGITVYSNTPLLPFINASEEEMLKLVYHYREAGIEFHHLYIAGLQLQIPWLTDYAVDVSTLIDIATKIRRLESGRSIPRFIIRSKLGEVDFGLTSDIMDSDEEGRVFIKLLPYDKPYFESFYKNFAWPEDVQIDEDGCPVLHIPGLKRTPEFLFA
ncbi:MAG: hypothetical protein GF313_05115 [Caldithrix sp.]|nr:hypothetical protein [Caldithrix sp.]